MQLHYIDTVIVRYDIAKVKICVSGGETPIFAICSKYVDFFMGCEMVSYSSDCGQVADPV